MALESCLNNKAFLIAALGEGLRVDGRGPYDLRAVRIAFEEPADRRADPPPSPAEASSALPALSPYGTATVQLGESRVFARVSGELVAPTPDRPTDGFFKTQFEYSPTAAPAFQQRHSAAEITITQVLNAALKKARPVSTEGFCVDPGARVWAVTLSLHILNHGGNLVDCACLAAVAALTHYKRPEVSLTDDGSLKVWDAQEREWTSLSLAFMPICVSFAFFKGGNLLVTDPNLLESLLSVGNLTFAMNHHGELCVVQKAGGVPLELQTIVRCSQVAAVKAKELTALVKEAVAADHARIKGLAQDSSRGTAESVKERGGRSGRDP